MRLAESGILGKIMADPVSNASECVNPAAALNKKPRLPKLPDFYGVFSLFTAGKASTE